MSTRLGIRALGPLASLALLCGGCATTQAVRNVEPSGFLKDYSQLQTGSGEQARLVYIDPGADFSRYHRVLIDPVTIWLDQDSGSSDISSKEAQRLARYLEEALHEQLAKEFTIAEQAGSGTIRIRVAITQVTGSRRLLDIASTVLPPARVLSTIKKLATGTHAFVGSAAIEMELLDGLSDERLAAAVDQRAGGKALRGSTGTWSDVEQAYEYWARLIAARLAILRRFDESEARWELEFER